MKISNFIKKELSGWSKFELFGVALIFSIIIYNLIILKDNPVAIVSAICGLLYTFFAGKGKISCYIFGLTGSGFYAYLALINSFFGNFILYIAYYIPMQITGMFKWKKHLKEESNEIYKTTLTIKERIFYIIITLFVSIVFSCILSIYGDKKPFLDGFSTIFSILGMLLTVKRCIEQWVVWGIVNFLCIIIWVQTLIEGQKVYSTVLMWACYFILSFYFYFKWKNEIENVKIQTRELK